MKKSFLFGMAVGLGLVLSACGDDSNSSSSVEFTDNESSAVVIDELLSSFDVSSSSEGLLPGSSANEITDSSAIEPVYSSAGETVDSSAVSSSSAEELSATHF